MLLIKLLIVLGIAATGVSGLAPQRQVLITYPEEAPQSDVNEYKNAITGAGGQVLHEFQLIKGFIVKASSQAIDTIRTLNQEFEPTVEDDQTVTIQDERKHQPE